METHHSLLGKLESRQARIGIIGLGYVGLPLALAYADSGFPVLGFDIDASKVHALNHGDSYIERVTPAQIGQAREQGFEATDAFERATECDALIICVPTPLTGTGNPTLASLPAQWMHYALI